MPVSISRVDSVDGMTYRITKEPAVRASTGCVRNLIFHQVASRVVQVLFQRIGPRTKLLYSMKVSYYNKLACEHHFSLWAKLGFGCSLF